MSYYCHFSTIYPPFSLKDPCHLKKILSDYFSCYFIPQIQNSWVLPPHLWTLSICPRAFLSMTAIVILIGEFHIHVGGSALSSFHDLILHTYSLISTYPTPGSLLRPGHY